MEWLLFRKAFCESYLIEKNMKNFLLVAEIKIFEDVTLESLIPILLTVTLFPLAEAKAGLCGSFRSSGH